MFLVSIILSKCNLLLEISLFFVSNDWNIVQENKNLFHSIAMIISITLLLLDASQSTVSPNLTSLYLHDTNAMWIWLWPSNKEHFLDILVSNQTSTTCISLLRKDHVSEKYSLLYYSKLAPGMMKLNIRVASEAHSTSNLRNSKFVDLLVKFLDNP